MTAKLSGVEPYVEASKYSVLQYSKSALNCPVLRDSVTNAAMTATRQKEELLFFALALYFPLEWLSHLHLRRIQDHIYMPFTQLYITPRSRMLITLISERSRPFYHDFTPVASFDPYISCTYVL